MTVRFLAGFAVLLAVLLTTTAIDPTGRSGLPIAAAVVLTALAVERVLHGTRPREALRALGLGRPAGRAIALAVAVGALIQLVYPAVAVLTGSAPRLRPDWVWLLVGIFAMHGVAEELVWRGYAYRRLRAGRSFRRAVLGTMPLVAVGHIPILVNSGLLVGAAALAVAAVTAVPFAHLFDTGRATLWAPAVLHTAIDTFKLFEIPPPAVVPLSLLLSAASITVPLLVLAPFRRRHG